MSKISMEQVEAVALQSALSLVLQDTSAGQTVTEENVKQVGRAMADVCDAFLRGFREQMEASQSKQPERTEPVPAAAPEQDENSCGCWCYDCVHIETCEYPPVKGRRTDIEPPPCACCAGADIRPLMPRELPPACKMYEPVF